MQITNNTTHSAAETFACGIEIGKKLKRGSVIAFLGDLGAGKTTLIKGLAHGASNIDPREINSPTFSYLNIYNGTLPIYHFDLYRLHKPEEFVLMGFDEYFQTDGITCIEWAEKILNLLPSGTIRIELRHISEEKREIIFL